MTITTEIDTDQVRDLVFNGFTREGAAIAVAESHGEDETYVEALLDALRGQRLEGESDEDFDTSHEHG
jgi:hypothetical protein